MANIFTRIKDSISADLHNMMDEKERKNPIAMLNQYLRECEKEVEKMRTLVERQYLLRDKFDKEIAHTKEMAAKRKHQAEVAYSANEEKLYAFAQQEQVQYEQRLERLVVARKEVTEQLADLEKKYALMQHKLKDMQLKRLELMSRENTARANMRANKLLDEAAGLNQPHSKFAELESYIDRIEEQVNTAYYRNTIDAKIAQLEKNQSQNEVKIED